MRWTGPICLMLAVSACGSQGPGAGADQSYSSVMQQATAGAASNYENPDRPRGGDAPAGIKQVHSELEYDANGKLITIPKEDRAAISDEQSFQAVKDRVSIKQDAARLERMREQYKVIPPQPLPPRPSSEIPNLVTYALNTHNSVGQPMYKRFGLFDTAASSARACARFTSADLAQEKFLERGGPQRDPLNLDPDGDGFACSWDPSPFRHDQP